MTRVIGVRFRTAGKIYFFDPLNFEIKRGDHVIVETARGIEFGTVMTGITEVEDEKVVQPLKPVIRIANERDHEQEANNKIKEKDAFRVCLEKIKKHELDMKLIDAEYTFDNNKVLFYFTADGRIDFRELVKDLAGVFKTRIELRQIGVRDETKIVGGIGICGRPLCCHSYLADFIPVSIKMAKEQNLSLNPTKISGVCGRLMCCLKNEEETYEELNRRLPGVGDFVATDDGLKGEVQSVNVLRQLVKVVVMDGDAKEIKEYPVERLQFRRRHGKKEKMELSREELRELEKLEKEEQHEGREGDGQQENEQRQGGKGRGRQGNEQRREGRDRQNGEQRREGRDRREGREYQNGEQRREGREYQNGEQRREGGEGQEGNNCQNGEQHREGREYRNGRQRREGREYQNGEQYREGGEGQEGSDCQNGEGREYRNGRQRREGREYQNGERRHGGREYQNSERRHEGREYQNGERRHEGREYQNGERRHEGREYQNGEQRREGRDRQEGGQRRDNRNRQWDGHRQEGDQRQHGRGRYNQGQNNRQRQEGQSGHDDNQSEGQ